MNLHLNHKHVLKDITLKIPISGEIIGIMGPNGAGKSSLLKSLIGSFNASGEMNLYGKPYINNCNILHIFLKKHN